MLHLLIDNPNEMTNGDTVTSSNLVSMDVGLFLEKSCQYFHFLTYTSTKIF